MKDKTAFEKISLCFSILSGCLAVVVSLENYQSSNSFYKYVYAVFGVFALAILVVGLVAMAWETTCSGRKKAGANKREPQSDFSLDMSGIRISPTLQSVESDSGYWQEDLVDDAMFVGTAKLVFSVKNCSDKDLLSVTFDKHDNKLDEDGERIPKESSSELCTTLAFWDKNQAKTDVTLSDGKVITCQKRLYWQLGIYVCSCKVEFDVLIKREKDPSEYNRWTLSPCHDGKCKTSEYKFREATQAQSNGK